MRLTEYRIQRTLTRHEDSIDSINTYCDSIEAINGLKKFLSESVFADYIKLTMKGTTKIGYDIIDDVISFEILEKYIKKYFDDIIHLNKCFDLEEIV